MDVWAALTVIDVKFADHNLFTTLNRKNVLSSVVMEEDLT